MARRALHVPISQAGAGLTLAIAFPALWASLASALPAREGMLGALAALMLVAALGRTRPGLGPFPLPALAALWCAAIGLAPDLPWRVPVSAVALVHHGLAAGTILGGAPVLVASAATGRLRPSPLVLAGTVVGFAAALPAPWPPSVLAVCGATILAVGGIAAGRLATPVETHPVPATESASLHRRDRPWRDVAAGVVAGCVWAVAPRWLDARAVTPALVDALGLPIALALSAWAPARLAARGLAGAGAGLALGALAASAIPGEPERAGAPPSDAGGTIVATSDAAGSLALVRGFLDPTAVASDGVSLHLGPAERRALRIAAALPVALSGGPSVAVVGALEASTLEAARSAGSRDVVAIATRPALSSLLAAQGVRPVAGDRANAGGRPAIALIWPFISDAASSAALSERDLGRLRRALAPGAAATLLLDPSTAPPSVLVRAAAGFVRAFEASAALDLGPGAGFLVVGRAGGRPWPCESVGHRLETLRAAGGRAAILPDLPGLAAMLVAGGRDLVRRLESVRPLAPWPPPLSAGPPDRRTAIDFLGPRDPARAFATLFDCSDEETRRVLAAARERETARDEELAAALARLDGNLDTAIARARNALAIDAESGFARATLGAWLLERGVAALRVGRAERAREDLLAALDLLDDPDDRARAERGLHVLASRGGSR